MSNQPYSLMLKKEKAHNWAIYCCAWKLTSESKPPSRDILVSSGLDATIKVWQIDEGKLELLHVLEGNFLAIISLSLSTDAYTLASCSLDSQCVIWDLEAGEKVHDIKTGPNVWDIAFSPNNLQLISGGQKGEVKLYSVQTGDVEKVIDTRGMFVRSIAWSPSGRHIACGAEDGRVSILEPDQGIVRHETEELTSYIRNVSFSPDSKLLLVSCHDKICVYYVTNLIKKCQSFSLKSPVLSVEFSPDNLSFAAGCLDGTLSIWKLKNNKCVHEFKEHTDAICGVQYCPDGSKIMSVSKDKSINIYECHVNKK